MTQQQFEALFPVICADLVGYIMLNLDLTEDEAITKLYSSEFYSLFSKEELKLWRYSTPLLYDMFVQLELTGKITYPDT